jgi:hypothetical protein
MNDDQHEQSGIAQRIKEGYAKTRAQAAAGRVLREKWEFTPTPSQLEAFVLGALWAADEISANFDLKTKGDVAAMAEAAQAYLSSGAFPPKVNE